MYKCTTQSFPSLSLSSVFEGGGGKLLLFFSLWYRIQHFDLDMLDLNISLSSSSLCPFGLVPSAPPFSLVRRRQKWSLFSLLLLLLLPLSMTLVVLLLMWWWYIIFFLPSRSVAAAAPALPFRHRLSSSLVLPSRLVCLCALAFLVSSFLFLLTHDYMHTHTMG